MAQTEPNPIVSKKGTIPLFRIKSKFLAYPVNRSERNVLSKAGFKKSLSELSGYSSNSDYADLKYKLKSVDYRTVKINFEKRLSVNDFRSLTEIEKFAYTEQSFLVAAEHSKQSSRYFLEFCQRLAIVKETVDHGKVIPFYKKLEISERTAQKWVAVGKVFQNLKPADVGGFDRSQLEVIATLKAPVRNAIIKSKIRSTVRGLSALKAAESDLIEDDQDEKETKEKIVRFLITDGHEIMREREARLNAGVVTSDSDDIEKRSKKPGSTTRKSRKVVILDNELSRIQLTLEELVNDFARLQRLLSKDDLDIKIENPLEIHSILGSLGIEKTRFDEAHRLLDDQIRTLISNKREVAR